MWRGVRAGVLAREGRADAADALAREAVALIERTDLLTHHGDEMLDLADVLTAARRDADGAGRGRGRAVWAQGQRHRGGTHPGCAERARRQTVIRPNFTDVSWDGSDLRIKGQSDPGEVSHIRGIVVTLSQKHDGGDPTISRPVIVEKPSGSGDWTTIVAGDGFERARRGPGDGDARQRHDGHVGGRAGHPEGVSGCWVTRPGRPRRARWRTRCAPRPAAGDHLVVS